VKKILILTAGYGEGHNAAARGIRDGLSETSPDTRVEIHDLFAETYGIVNSAVRTAYLDVIYRVPAIWSRVYRWLDNKQHFTGSFRVFWLVKRRLAKLIRAFQPDVIICVYPAYSHILDDMFGVGQSAPTRVVMVTDSITINAIWYRCGADYFLVPNRETADVLKSEGVAADAVRAFGFPVSPRFARIAPRTESEKGPWRILYMTNARRRSAPGLASRLAALPNVELTVMVGRSKPLRRAIEAVNAGARVKFTIVGWTNELPEMLQLSHLVISKAGGATVQETIAAGCPMIVNHVVPGQEEGNARLLVQNGAGALALTNDDVMESVTSAFADDATIWRSWQANVARMSRPAASLEIAQFLTSL